MISGIFDDQRKMTMCMFMWCAIVMYAYSQSVQKNNTFLNAKLAMLDELVKEAENAR